MDPERSPGGARGKPQHCGKRAYKDLPGEGSECARSRSLIRYYIPRIRDPHVEML
jgi:hypothetical protein